MQALYNSLINALQGDCQNLAPPFEDFVKEKPNSFNRVVPAKTLTVSVTADKCEQNCAHCGGHYLLRMKPLDKIDNADLSKYNSLLISGGALKTGEVPIKEHINKLLSLPERLKFNAHTGFQDPKNILPLKKRISAVSFDLPSCDEVVSNVFKLPYKATDYERLYLEYKKHFNTIAHLTLGLALKTKNAEQKIIDFLAQNGEKKVVLLVFMPTKGTEAQDLPKMPLSKVISVIKYAKKQKLSPSLGCMRPMGAYRKNLDILAFMYGLKKIVMASPVLIKILEENGVSVAVSNECCALTEA